jgi:hypothetical protein
MEVKLKYRGLVVTESDVASIREFIAANPTASRWALSRKLCATRGWVQSNGVLRDMVCRGLLLALHRERLIDLPPVRQVSPNPLVIRARPAPVPIDTTPVEATLGELQPLDFRQVRRTPEERLFNGLIEEHHYLGYTQPVGEHLKYMIYGGGRPVACMAWSSAPRHLGPRDRFIGWSPEQRRRNIRLLAYNTRYLIMPWVRVQYLASHILGRMAKILPRDWARVYGHPVLFLETFTDPARYKGTCYHAANWVVLGRTTGRGNNAPTKKATVPVKEILGYPLSKRFREILGSIG